MCVEGRGCSVGGGILVMTEGVFGSRRRRQIDVCSHADIAWSVGRRCNPCCHQMCRLFVSPALERLSTHHD